MINNPAQGSEARFPRGVVKVSAQDAQGNQVANETMDGWISWEVDNNTFAQADTFNISFAVGGLPANRGADWWTAQNEIYIEIFAGFPADPNNFTADQLSSLIYGRADEISFDPVARTLELHGRDLTAQLIDSINSDKWQNQTSSEIANIIATRHGLQFAGTTTTTKVGNYYQIENASLGVRMSDWDLLCRLAELEQFVVYVAGHKLHFEPMPSENDEPYVIQWQQVEGHFDANALNLSFSRNLSLAKGAKVTVNSFNLRSGSKVSATYPANPAPGAQAYVKALGHLDSAQAKARAQAIYSQLIRHEVKLSAELPADNTLSTANVIRITGTGTGYDQLYYPDSIVRRMSMEEGYRMTVGARNKSFDNENVQ